MIRTSPKPLHEWRRHHPMAQRIASELLACRGLLRLRTRRLTKDIKARFGVCDSTAAIAVSIARRNEAA